MIFIDKDSNAQNSNYIPREGYVPNKETAIKIAEAIWLPIYGNKIYNSKPFRAKTSEWNYLDCRRYFTCRKRRSSLCGDSKK